MIPQAGNMNYPKPEKMHTCQRHKDLTILIKSAYKKICNTCFASLKKSYFNVIAGLLLEMHYLHNITRRLVEQNNDYAKRLQDQEQAILNLSTEIAEHKNNGRDHEKKNPQTKPVLHREPTLPKADSETSDTKALCAEGHLAKVARSLQNLLHIQISRIMLSWRKSNGEDTPK